MRSKNPSLEYFDRTVRKRGDPALLAVEAEKTRLGRQIGEQSGLFYVPKVVGFDAECGVLEFERIPGLVTLYELATDGTPGLLDLLQTTGKALAAIHEQLVLPAHMRTELPGDWMDDDENVFIHGDFTGQNVALDESTGRLVVLDWSAAPILEGRPTFGTRYFDIVWFSYYTYYAMPFKCIHRWDAEAMVNRFLEGYTQVSKRELSWLKYRKSARLMSPLRRALVWRQTVLRPWPKNVAYFCLQALTAARWRAYQPKRLAGQHVGR